MHLLPTLVVLGKMWALGGWCGFTCDRIESRFDVSLEEAHSVFSKQGNNFDANDDEFCDGLTTDEENLGRDLEGWIDFGGIADDVSSYDGRSLALRVEALKNEAIDFFAASFFDASFSFDVDVVIC